MKNVKPTYRHLFSGFAAVAAVVTANLLAAEADREPSTDSVSSTSIAVPAAPAPIDLRAIDAPEVPAASDAANAAEFIVPVLSRPDLRLPPPPLPAVGEIRRAAEAWLGRGVMEAPAAAIAVEPPDVETYEDASAIRVPALERPSLPEPPAVR